MMTVSLAAGLTSDAVRIFELPALQPEKLTPRVELALPSQAASPPEPTPTEVRDATWPRAGRASVAAGGSPQRAGDLPVTVATEDDREQQIDVELVDQAVAQEVGTTGVVVVVTPRGDDTDARMSVGVDYSGFRNASGGDYGARLRLEQLPQCALTTPQVPQCQVRTPLPSTNDNTTHTVTAAMAAEPVVLAATAEAEGPDGTFKASPLSPSGTWAVSGSAGSFSWSYPIVLPPAASGGPVAPSVSLSYSASTVDGRTMATNNQSSWIGQGWNYSPGAIERTYRTCAQDKTLPPTQQTGDLCWAGEIVTMNLGGQATELVYDQGRNTWRAANDGGSRIELVSGAANGVHAGEHWKVTNTAGVSYYFGRNRGPGYTNQEQTNSAWTAPVYGPRSSDKCHNPSGFAASWCMQAWRWNLDYVEDTHGNVTTYYYAPETNHYGANNQTTGISYTRGGTLKRIDYGLRNVNGSIYGAVAPNQVVFDVTERCQPSSEFDCAPTKFNSVNGKYWPDVPQDQECKSGAVCNVHSPSYWSTKRLTTITTQYNPGTGPVKVDEYLLAQQFPHANDTVKELLLSSITRTGHKGSVSTTLPAVTFAYQSFDNRVVGYRNMSAMAHKRLTEIRTETGTAIRVTYSNKDCTAASVPTDLANSGRRCYPVYWTLPFNQDPTLDFFHKYVVDKVEVQDLTAVSPTQVTSYKYLGTPAWHYDDFELVRPEHRTYGQFRGYGQVEVRTGNPAYTFPTLGHPTDGTADKQTLTRTTYLRGMDGASVTNSLGETLTDHAKFAGTVFEIEAFNGDGGARLSTSLTEPAIIGTTATRARAGLPALTADIVAVTRSRTITQLAAGGTRTATTISRYDGTGRLTDRTESGDGVPDLCTRTTYADNTTTWVRDRVAETITSQQVCPTDNVAQTSILNSARTYYDKHTTLGQVTVGDATRVDAATVNTGDQLTYATTATATYDAAGRAASKTDALQRMTGIAYTPTDGGVLTKTVTTNAKNQTSTVELDPARGKPATTIDVGGRRTDAEYDALGRLTAVWKPGRRKLAQDDASVTYSYLLRTDGPLAITTKTLVDHGSGTNYLTKIDLFDAFGQLRQTQADAVGGGTIGTDTFHDSHGRVRHTYNRWTATGAPATTLVGFDKSAIDDRTVADYDGAGRQTLTTSYHGLTPTKRTRTVHSGDRTTVFPPHGAVIRTVIVDVRGREIESRDYTSRPVIDGDNVTGGAFQTATREYSSLGQLKKVTDPAGNQWTFTYDLLGRKISQTDPDAGTTSTTYDLAGQVLTTTDARNRTLAFTYDVLGRKTAEYADSTSGTKLAEWRYDGAQQGVGLPWYSTRYTTHGAYDSGPTVYNGSGLVSKAVTRIPVAETGLNATYTTTYGHTTTGLQVYVQHATAAGGFPNGEIVSTTYDRYGNPATTFGYNTYVSGSTYTPFGEARQFILGPSNNVAKLTYDYDAHTRRLTQANLSAQKAEPQVDDTRYHYDEAGNVTRSVNTQGPEGRAAVRTQCYSYDPLRRLNNAWTATDGCAASPSTTPGHANIGGPTPYWTSWIFKSDGLRATQTRHALPGTTGDTITNYAYPAAGSARPHSLTSATTTGPTGQTLNTYEYDSSGSTTRRVTPSGEHVFDWDHENRLSTVTSPTGTTKYVYDADGNQLIRRDPGKTTLYLPGQELTRDNTNGTVVGTRYYTHGRVNVALRVGNTNPNYLASDLHNTMSVAVESVGFAVSRRTMDPYGNQLNPIEGLPWPDRHGFLNKPVSEAAGLTDIGARKYDPVTGRFISVDPILDLTDPQQWNGYVYAQNNPTTFSDPTGLATWMCPDGECGRNGRGGLGYDRSGSNPSTVSKPASNPIAPTTSRCGNSSYVQVSSCGSSTATGSTANYPACSACRNGPMTREKAQILVDVLGMVPLLGEPADLVNCGIHFAHGEVGDAGMSCAAAVPFAGWIAAGAKMAKNGEKLADASLKAAKCANSFTGDTLVLMADGSSKRIDQIKVGDKVANSEPEGERTESHEVLKVHVANEDKHYVDLTISTQQGPETIRTTAHHPFYDAGSRDWVEAGKLRTGTKLATTDGGRAEVVLTRHYEAVLRTYNLSVDMVPTFYVLAGALPVLVHNTGPCEHIALGLQDARDNPMALDEFAMERGAATYHDWPGKGPWHEKFNQFLAPDSSTKISFNLDGIDDAVASARNGKAVDPSGFEGLTNWELYRISQSPAAWSRITWYKDGRVADNPFG